MKSFKENHQGNHQRIKSIEKRILWKDILNTSVDSTAKKIVFLSVNTLFNNLLIDCLFPKRSICVVVYFSL